MARRGWGGSIATAVGVAAGAGAAQLGFGYGLGIVDWAPADAGAAPAAWVASLVWATWIAATSTVLGAVCAYRLHERALAEPPPPADATNADHPPVTGPSAGGPGVSPPADRPGSAAGRLGRAGLAVAAGLGGLITVLLVAVPARVAAAPDTGTPQRVAAGYAAIGVLMGVLTALWALRSRAAAANVIATVAWLWLLAVVAVVDGVLAGRGLASAQLGIWQISADRPQFWIRDYLYWPGAVLSLGSALVIGVLAARRAARAPVHRIGAAASGAAGPLLVAVAYLLAVPRLSAISPEQVSAHLIAPYAVIVGVGGSVLVAALAQRAGRRPATRHTGSAATVDEGTAPAGERAPALADGAATERPASDVPVPAGPQPARPGSDAPPADPGQPDGEAAAPAAPRTSSVPRVPAPRTGEADRLDPVDAVANGPDATPPEPDAPARRRGGRRTGRS
ncbi:hypothetical protein [Micromonospora sp. URMC 103]|uniref:hypothetical protein n=1 Tax=Micromonospora sp. URMC 103 TaxID=3423406 RepID=UPI003F1A178D